MEKRKTLQEIALEKGKLLLVENFSISTSSLLVEKFQEGKHQIVESKKGNQYECVAVVKNVPVTRFTENLNGRIYPRKLWEKIYKSKVAEGTLCLADHPLDNTEGSVKDIVGVWRNFSLNESTCTGDLYLIGNHGKQFLEVLKAGGKCGLSSVGFGELTEDGKTVDFNTYELVRLSDWVLTPSQEVFAEIDNLVESVKLSESKNNTNLMREHKMSSIQALTVRNNVKVALKESLRALEMKGSSLVNAKKELQEVLSYIPEEYKEDRLKLTNQINLLEKTIKEALKDKTEKLQESTQHISNLKIKYESSNAILAKLKEKHQKATQVIKLISENENLMKKDIQTLMSERGLMYKDIKFLKEDVSKMSRDISKLVTERGTILKDLKLSLKEKESMLSDISNLLEDRKSMMKNIKNLQKENSILKAKLAKFKEEDLTGGLDYQLGADEQVVQDNEYEDEDFGLQIDTSMAYSADDEDFGGVPFTQFNQGGILGEKNKKQRIKEQKTSIVVNKDVVRYFEEQVKKKPILKSIKERVISQPNLVHAVKLVEKFLKADNDKPVQLKEAFRNNTWIGNRDI